MNHYPATKCPTCGTLVDGRDDNDSFPKDGDMVRCPNCPQEGYLEVNEECTRVVFIQPQA